MLYIRAQVTRIDLKIDLAMCEVMRRYKALVRRASGVSFSLAGSTIHRKNAATKVCKAIMNCFGLPGVSADTAIAAMKQNVWTDHGVDIMVCLAEGINIVGYIGTGFAGGIPAWLVTGAISLPLVVPATCRLFLTMAADLMLVLIRAFKEATFRKSAQPQERDVQAAARIYRLRGYSTAIHKDIKTLVPRRNLAASYKFETISQRLEGIVARYKDKLVDDLDLPTDAKASKPRGSAEDEEDDDSRQADSEYREISELNKMAVELEGSNPATELPDNPIDARAELPGSERPAELMGDTPRADLASPKEERGKAGFLRKLSFSPRKPAELLGDSVRAELASPNDVRPRAELPSTNNTNAGLHDRRSVACIKEPRG